MEQQQCVFPCVTEAHAVCSQTENNGDARMNRKLRDILVLVATCLTLLWCIPSVGQVLKGSISGTAVDQQGAVVSGAQVKATDTATGAVHTTTTDSSGLFRFNLIPAGDYKIEVSAPQFKTAVQNRSEEHTSELQSH